MTYGRLCHIAGTMMGQTQFNVNEDRLAFILRSPELVERAVRAALARVQAARGLRGEAIDVHAFGNVALEALDGLLFAEGRSLDAVARHEIHGATLRAAARFGRSALARRLLALPAERFGPPPPRADAFVYDERQRVHVVRIEAYAVQAARLEEARRIAATLPAGLPGLHEPAIHMFSLRDGRLRSFRLSNAGARPTRPTRPARSA